MRAERRAGLSSAQVRLLRRLADAGPEPAVARRARVLLGEEPVSRQTAAKWAARFAEQGADGLRDLPRAGRPPTHGDESVRSILVAPLLAPTARWTSHTVAGLTGQSQTAVVRAWRQAFEVGAAHPAGPLPSGGLALVGARCDASNSVLVLAAHATAVPPERATPFMRSPRRPPLQALLAADLLASTLPPDPASTPGPAATPDLVAAVRRRLGTRTPLFVLSRRPLPAPTADVPGVEYLPLAPGDRWQGLLETLVRRCTATPQPHLAALQQRLMAWAQGVGGPFEWLEDGAPDRAGRRPAPPGGEPRPTGQVVADAVLASVLDRIAAGRLAAGDRVTESSLSRAVHASRGHVREALLVLASNGLVDLEPRRGALVPAPQVADVVETYAVRRALGALLVRRAAQSAPGSLDPVERALAALVTVAATGDARASGEADIGFQDALALSTGMRRVPRMFVALSSQIRLFTAVMGVRYAYSVPQMVRDDTLLLQQVAARDEASALQTWHTKMDDAVGYMLTQLGSPGPPVRR
ncbi:FCD domain-containing protein [Kineosporia sp. A_224]|uniref:FCD domain-containing protein n=1 Tax=Kineosporia sp. A_224 TaxID=1962180 RepID=UPI00117A8D37|nr:FCD domain-containing protein [Kineosporia sp. A_224]